MVSKVINTWPCSKSWSTFILICQMTVKFLTSCERNMSTSSFCLFWSTIFSDVSKAFQEFNPGFNKLKNSFSGFGKCRTDVSKLQISFYYLLAKSFIFLGKKDRTSYEWIFSVLNLMIFSTVKISSQEDNKFQMKDKEGQEVLNFERKCQ